MKNKADTKIHFSSIFIDGYFPYVWIVLAICIIYAKILTFGYTFLDDDVLLHDNYQFISHAGNIVQAFRQDILQPTLVSAYYRPLVTVSFMLNAHMSGPDSLVWYHATDILLHAIVAVLLFVFLQKFNISRLAAFLLTLIYAVHPVLTDGVAWIPGRQEPLMTIFVLLSMLSLLRFLAVRKKSDLVLHVVYFFLALLVKESAIALLGVACLYIYMYGRDQRSYIYKIVSAWMVALLVWAFLRANALQYVADLRMMDVWRSVWAYPLGVLVYIGKIFFPIQLSVYPVMADVFLYTGVLAISIVGFMLWKSREKNMKNILFGCAWFFIFLIPSALSSQTWSQIDFRELRVYTPLIGIMIVVGEIDIFKKKYIHHARNMVSIVCCFVLFSVLTFIRLDVYRDRLSFWHSAIDTSPHAALSYVNLAMAYTAQNDVEDAKQLAQKAIELNHGEQMAHYVRGYLYFGEDDYDRAIEEFEQEIRNNPFDTETYLTLGAAYYREDRFEDAKRAWQRGLEIRPDDQRFVHNLTTLEKKIDK